MAIQVCLGAVLKGAHQLSLELLDQEQKVRNATFSLMKFKMSCEGGLRLVKLVGKEYYIFQLLTTIKAEKNLQTFLSRR